MRIFNRDGYETEMCGNGLRCFTLYLSCQGHGDGTYLIQSQERIHHCTIKGDQISVEMGDPTEILWNQQVPLGSTQLTLHTLNTGVPHAVVFLPLLDELDVTTLGRSIRHYKQFQPKGVNANFAEITDSEIIHLRTYERGVEEETQACGTGATATALAAAHIYGFTSPVTIRTKSKDLLHISFKKNGDSYSDIILTGPAEQIFEGSFKYPFPLIRSHSFAYN